VPILAMGSPPGNGLILNGGRCSYHPSSNGPQEGRVRALGIRRQGARTALCGLGPSSLSQYVAAARARGPREPYDAKASWTERYEGAIAQDRFEDVTTIARNVSAVHSRSPTGSA
jgi:hypothetical protein